LRPERAARATVCCPTSRRTALPTVPTPAMPTRREGGMRTRSDLRKKTKAKPEHGCVRWG